MACQLFTTEIPDSVYNHIITVPDIDTHLQKYLRTQRSLTKTQILKLWSLKALKPRMNVSLLHPTQLRVLLEGHRDGLFKDYGARIKPIKLCLGVVPLAPGELVASSPSHSMESSEMGRWVDEDKVDFYSCFRLTREEREGEEINRFGGDIIGEKLEVDKDVGGWLGKVIARIPLEDPEYPLDVQQQGIPRNNLLPLLSKKYSEELPVLSKMSEDEKAEWTDGKRFGWLYGDEDIDILRFLPLRVPAVRIEKYPGALEKLKEPFRRSKEEKKADGEDGGVRWTKKVRRDIGQWVRDGTAGERLKGDESVVRWIMEVVKREANINMSEEREWLEEEGNRRKVEKEESTEKRGEEEILFPLELSKTGNVGVEMDWPPGKKEMEGMKSIAADGGENYEKDLLGEFREGYIMENLGFDDENTNVSIEGIGTPKATSLHIPSSPPIYHLVSQSTNSCTFSQLSPMGKKCNNEDLYIEGPITPLPSSPYPFHHDNPKSIKKPRQKLNIYLPPPDPTPPSQASDQEKMQAIPSNIVSEGKFFIASIAQEQLSAEDGQLREEVPIIDINPEKMRLAAPWDGIDVLISKRDGAEMDIDNDWLGLAGVPWGGEKVIALELLWRPFHKKSWGMELLKEVIGGEDDHGEGGGFLEEVERLGEIGNRLEENLSTGYDEMKASKIEDEEEESELEAVLEKLEEIGVSSKVLGKRKRQGSEIEGNSYHHDARNQEVNNEKLVLQPPLPRNGLERASPISHSAKSAEPGPSVDTHAHASKKGRVFAPILKPLGAPFSATASLAALMVMRNCVSPISPITYPKSQTPIQKATTSSALPPTPPEKPIPTPVLPKILPKAQFVLSTTLLQTHRAILRALKKLWGKNADWIEREYTPTSQSRLLNPTGDQKLDTNLLDLGNEYTHTPSLLLSPTSGMYMTSFQDIREHVFLPGEREPLHPDVKRGEGISGVRQSIYHMAKTVDTLWVMVNAAGKLTSGRDSLHWSSFVGFCAIIQECRVVPVLIASGIASGSGTGGEEVISQYITKIMLIEVDKWRRVVERVAPWWVDDDNDSESNQLDINPPSPDLPDEIDEATNSNTWLLPTPTTGELFLRKAGINVFAAGVILRELSRLESEYMDEQQYQLGHGYEYEDGDKSGDDVGSGVLRRLFTMGKSSRERLFTGLLGGKVVKRLEGIIEGVWSGVEGSLR